MNTDTLELGNCDIKALLEIARNLTRERDAALKRLNSSERARKSLSEACDYLQAKQDATERLVRELRDALDNILYHSPQFVGPGVASAKLALTKVKEILK